MKKIFAPLLMLILLTACSPDSDEAAPTPVVLPAIDSYLKVTIGGVEHTYARIAVETETVTVGTTSYIDLHFKAFFAAETDPTLEFTVEQFKTGTSACHYFYYKFDGLEYEFDPLIDPVSMFSINVTSNDSNHLLKGIFSGTLRGFDGTHMLAVSNGSFQTRY